MPPSRRHSPHLAHTVDLRSATSCTANPTVIGLKQQHLTAARGSPPRHAPQDVRGSVGPPSRTRARVVQQTQQHREREGDLLVHFGIDSLIGRMVVRVLVLMTVFQPVYVALGMELDEGVDEGAVEEVAAESSVEELVVSEVEQEVESEPPVTESEETADSITIVEDEVPPVEDGEVEQVVSASGDDIDGVVESTSYTVSSTSPETTGDVFDETTDEQEQTSTSTDDAVLVATSTDDGTSHTEDTQATSSTQTTTGGGTSGSSGGSSRADDDDDEAADTASGNDAQATSTDPTDNNNETETDDTEQATSTDSMQSGDQASGSATDAQGTSSPAAIAPVASSTGLVRDDGFSSTTDAYATESHNATNKYMFGEGDCTLVSDGEFYCVADSPQKHMTGDPRAYAEKDREGDREIYYFNGVEVQRVTNNSYDDFAPVFDEKSKRIVWQAMINDRLQVMLYDIPTNATRQITTSRQNSSNPHIVDDVVVWQEWVETNWEIMMTDVDNNGAAFEIERLTDNVVHDMFPRAYDDLITWQSEKGASWEVIVYDMRTGEQYALEKGDDTMYENPRFVLLFDSRHGNGDVETIGYDLDTGEMMELGTRAKPIPSDPVTPDDETSDALTREATSTPQVKVGREDGGDGEDDVVVH